MEELRARGNVFQNGFMSLVLILFQHLEERKKCINWLDLQSSEALMLSCFHRVMEKMDTAFLQFWNERRSLGSQGLAKGNGLRGG